MHLRQKSIHAILISQVCKIGAKLLQLFHICKFFFLLYCIKVRVGIIIFVENQHIRYFSMPKKVRKKYSF